VHDIHKNHNRVQMQLRSITKPTDADIPESQYRTALPDMPREGKSIDIFSSFSLMCMEDEETKNDP
jgi:hypothetical protein